MCALYKACTGERAWKAIGDRLQAPSYLSRVDYYYIIVALFYVFLCCSMYYLFCDVPCIVCVYMCTEQLPPGGYPIGVKYIISRLIKFTSLQSICVKDILILSSHFRVIHLNLLF